MGESLFKQDPFAQEALRPGGICLIPFLYTPSDNPATDRANADAELAKKLLLFDSDWDDNNGGIMETTDTGGITSIAVGDGTLYPLTTGYTSTGDDIVVKGVRAWESSGSSRSIPFPVLIYDGDIVPFNDYSHLGDGNDSGDLVLIVDNSSGKYSVTASKWQLVLLGMLPGVSDVNMGGKPLSYSTQEIKQLSIQNPVFTRTVEEGGPGSGDFTWQVNKGRAYVANGAGGTSAEILNHPGEDLEKAVYGDDWTAEVANEITYRADAGLGFALVQFNTEFPDLNGLAADAGQHFATVYIHYGCRLADMPNPANQSGDNQDVVQIQPTVEWRQVYKRIFVTKTT